jgi:cyclomaltodextrinase / maltogenic alpha-amylase / neopullulanase
MKSFSQSVFPLFTTAVLIAALATTLQAAPATEPIFNWDRQARALPEWARNATIYEINVRQYSEAGTFAAVETDLDRIASLGVEILWLMPIHPIGEVNRKGSLGSYYAVRDYFGVNPEFGDAESFRSFVRAAHARGLKVILDWVANHSSWDNPLTQTQPELYEKNEQGQFVPPHGTDWTDVIQFDLEHPGLLRFHIEAMRYWVTEFGVDGFRCDYALGLPVGFWEKVGQALRQERSDIFLLAESDQGEMLPDAFNLIYGWELMHGFDAIAQGRAPANSLDAILARRSLILPRNGLEMLMITNHDENSWNGTVFERLGGGHRTFAALSFTMNGVPLIYNGQEIGLDRRLEFFEKDPIQWSASPLFSFYQKLVKLRSTHPALLPGSPTTRIPTTNDAAVYAFLRGNPAGPSVLVVANLTARNLSMRAGHRALAGNWKNAFTGQQIELEANASFTFRSWEFVVLER